MRVKKAQDLYIGKAPGPRLNCAQEVAEVLKDRWPLSETQKRTLSLCGGGMAPEGVCGSFYAVQMLIKEQPELIEDCRQIFIQQAGSEKCREIKKLRRLSCLGCIAKSVEFLEKIPEIKTDGP